MPRNLADSGFVRNVGLPIGRRHLRAIVQHSPWVEHRLADAAYCRHKLAGKAGYLDFVVEITGHRDGAQGFSVLPRR